MTNHQKWILKSIFCISCGKPMGIMMQKTQKQLYFYCHNCHKKHLADGKDLEKIYNSSLPMEMQD